VLNPLTNEGIAMKLRDTRRRSFAATAIGMVACAGIALIVAGIVVHSTPPAPGRTAAGRLTPGAGNNASERPVETRRSRPVQISIPAIGVRANLLTLGLNADGTIQVPAPGPTYDRPGWYRYSPTPGQVGPSIILGHVDSAAQGPADFYRLGELRPGERIDVTLLNHKIVVFAVLGVRSFPKTAFPTRLVYGRTRYPALRLITCGGAFDASTGHYLNNTVVFAAMRSVRPTTSISG
jgi:hypothetical protein